MMMMMMMPFASPIPKPCFVAAPRARVRASAVQARPAAVTMYELLSVDKSAGPEDIKAAYRRQARRWHPDTCHSAADKNYFAEQFMRAKEAYEVLSDPDLRRDYDLALLRPAGGWAAAVGGGVIIRRGDARRFGDWERQLEGLRRRRSGGAAAAGRWMEGELESWGSRMRRRARDVEASG
ncbi:chaperone protein dnaJ 20, chloroplastic-like [Canna indica]|uniref:Chaperone protein dnaJ 20, chloroplastic-like n=1 Tax=Canna indica TaxID=4628 RepID=A0AAQ3JPK1_9LILI|nr:chaperone protein dnaJ 20, chloroplastic-like [Canna indica]